LSSLNEFVPEQLSSEVECDELELALNNKGSRNLDRTARKKGNDFIRNMGKEDVTVVQVVTTVERKGEKYLKAFASKRLSKEEISKALDGKLAYSATLITDKHPSLKLLPKTTPP